jgi:hypothetical protein
VKQGKLPSIGCTPNEISKSQPVKRRKSTDEIEENEENAENTPSSPEHSSSLSSSSSSSSSSSTSCSANSASGFHHKKRYVPQEAIEKVLSQLRKYKDGPSRLSSKRAKLNSSMLREHAEELIKLTANSNNDTGDSLKENDLTDYSSINTIQTPLAINVKNAEDKSLLENNVSDQASYTQLSEHAKYDDKMAYSKPLQPISTNIMPSMQSINPMPTHSNNQTTTLSYNQSTSHGSSSILAISTTSLNISSSSSSSSSNGTSSSSSSGTSSCEEDSTCIANTNYENASTITCPPRPKYQLLQQSVSIQDYVDNKYFSNYLMMPKFYNRNVDIQYSNQNNTGVLFNHNQPISSNSWATMNTNQLYGTSVPQSNHPYQQNQSDFYSHPNNRYNASLQSSNPFVLNYDTMANFNQTPITYSNSNSHQNYQQPANNENVFTTSPNIPNKTRNVAF